MHSPTRFFLSVAALLLFSVAAHADTFELFEVNATLSNGGTLTGTIGLDLNSDANSHTESSYQNLANLTYTFSGSSISFTGDNSAIGQTGGLPFVTGLDYTTGRYDTLSLY